MSDIVKMLRQGKDAKEIAEEIGAALCNIKKSITIAEKLACQ